MRRIPLALLFLPLSAIAQIKPDLSITFLRSFERIGRGETRTMRFMVGTAGAVLHDVRVTLSVANGGTISVTPPSGFTCSEGVCTAPAFGPQPGTFDLQLVAPDREGGDRVVLHVVGTSSDEGEQRGNENYVFNKIGRAHV